MSTPALLIAGTHSGCGKTTISMGLMAALTQRGLRVQAFKAGPDYIDPLFHSALTGRPSRNLDSWMLGKTIVQRIFASHAATADIAIVEGVMGLFDGLGTNAEGSSAELAKLLCLPVVLVVDAAGSSLSCAALVKGFAEFDPNLPLAAVILNRVGSAGHYQLLKSAIETHTRVKVAGWLGNDAAVAVESRHLGLVPAGEHPDLLKHTQTLVAAMEATIDFQLLQNLAAGANQASQPDLAEFLACKYSPQGPKVRIAVARDRAFNFHYADNLDLLEQLGAELVYFSPLQDSALPPDCQGLYLCGGFPETCAAELSANQAMRREVRRFAQVGGPIYGECGGFMYLCREIDGQAMVGVFDATVVMTDRLQRFGYVQITTSQANLWGPAGQHIRGHEFHYSKIDGWSGTISPSYQVSRANKAQNASWDCGFVCKNTLGSYAHLHFLANPDFARNFVQVCRQFSVQG